MDNYNGTNTSKDSVGKILILILAVIILILGLTWMFGTKPEKFQTNNLNSRALGITNSEHQLKNFHTDAELLDESIRRQALAHHQKHMAEMKIEEEQSSRKLKQESLNRLLDSHPMAHMPDSSESTFMPLSASVPIAHSMYDSKPFETHDSHDSPLVAFAKSTQAIVNQVRPNEQYKQVPNDNGSFYQLTADDRTIALMNQVDPDRNIDDVACNLSNTLTESDKKLMSDYKNKYYNKYAHQISCANGKGNLTGCGKKCYANSMTPETCSNESCENSLSELNNGPDFVTLNQLALKKNNLRPCSTCTQKPMLSRAVGVQNILDQVTDLDNVSRSFMDSQVLGNNVSGVQEDFSDLEESRLRAKDKEQVLKKKVTFANVNNFANFNNYISQNGVLETSVDKLAEIRSNTTNSATCELSKYGQSIGEVYDGLMKNPYMQYSKACNTEKITGILEDSVGDYAHIN
jgi:hypothetical protein